MEHLKKSKLLIVCRMICSVMGRVAAFAKSFQFSVWWFCRFSSFLVFCYTSDFCSEESAYHELLAEGLPQEEWPHQVILLYFVFFIIIIIIIVFIIISTF